MDEKDYKLLPEDRKLLTKDLCARLLYGVMCKVFLDTDNHILNKFDKYSNSKLETVNCQTEVCTFEHLIGYYFGRFPIDTVRPYLRPMSSMTKEEAMEVAELWGLEDILSISVKENYISVELDDGVAGSETYTIWFNEIVASIKLFDWLNAHHFDYRGLIEKGLALEAPEGMYKN